MAPGHFIKVFPLFALAQGQRARANKVIEAVAEEVEEGGGRRRLRRKQNLTHRGDEKTINTMYSTARPKENTLKTIKKTAKTYKTMTPLTPLNPS